MRVPCVAAADARLVPVNGTYPVAQIRVSLVPIPAALLLFFSGLVGLGVVRRSAGVAG